MTLPIEKQEILASITNDLKAIANIRAIVLGGSYATGTANETSDLDVGIYYFDAAPFDIEDIRSIARKYASSGNPTVTGFYEWGPWVNGGAWINTAAGRVDLLYKNIEQIRSTIEKAKNGVWENHFEQQPPYGFSSIIFLAETRNCISLYDPDEIIKNLKSDVLNYPAKLKQSVIQQSLWSAEFTIWHADHFAAKHDIYNTMGCLTRAVKEIVTALFGINELYPMGDKRAIECLEKSGIKPASLKQKIEKILCVDKNTPGNNIALLKTLWKETIELSPYAYNPYYNLSDLIKGEPEEKTSMSPNNFEIRSYDDKYRQQVLAVWEASVLATHDFLSPADFREIKEVVNTIDFNAFQVYCLVNDEQVLGFIGIADRKIEMLFLDPKYFGLGLGKMLMNFATVKLGADKVDVNEQNKKAVTFYQKFGFETFERTDKDDQDRDYPLFRMRLKM